MQTATVIHRTTGQTFTVRTPVHRPNAQRRQALRELAAGGVDRDGLLPCAGCGVRTGATATVWQGVAVASGEADRTVRDHPAFDVVGEVGYGEATVLNVCPSCNGSTGRTAHLDNLEAAALQRLQRHADEG